jgi:multidrug efflux pump subunit AcrA (membrane-fusion protein)
MFLRARVISGEPRQAVLIPKTCLTAKQGKNAEVFTVSQGRIFIKKVVTGVEKEDRVEITRGLNEGETVVDTPSPILKEGQEVEMEK